MHIAPLYKVLNRLEVPRLAHTENQMTDPDFEVRVAFDVAGSLLGTAAAFDLVGIAPNLRAPVIQHLHFMRNPLGVAEAMPHIGVFRGNLQCHLLATTADQNGNLAQRLRDINLPAMFDDLQRFFQCGQATARCAKIIAVFAIIALKPARANTQDQPSIIRITMYFFRGPFLTRRYRRKYRESHFLYLQTGSSNLFFVAPAA
ncbi:MAG TPA: hypothetical protein VFV38_43025 [Ktedonobacteraceae bacterium]|nr:hypothetical protein [Ktedonobacteraceae bacterium]